MTGQEKQDIGEPRRTPLALTIDYALYEEYLEGSDLSEAQKREFLDALWSIIVEFVMLGFDVHPAQAAQEACGKPPRGRSARAKAALASGNSKKDDFKDAAGADVREAAGRI